MKGRIEIADVIALRTARLTFMPNEMLRMQQAMVARDTAIPGRR
jgi:hypothetical protein